MFERFTADARDVVMRAQEETRDLGHAWIGAEHLVLPVLAKPGLAGAGALATVGLTYGAWRAALVAARELEPGLGTPDEVALSTLGIDLAEVRRRVEAGFGPGALELGVPEPEQRGRLPWRRPRADAAPPKPQGHIPFSPAAKKALEQSLREALELKDKTIGVEHVLLGVVHPKAGPVLDLLRRLGTSADAVRAAVLSSRGEAA
jgi:ATP-dependent Clp protease ATP-binding subunit ClpA